VQSAGASWESQQHPCCLLGTALSGSSSGEGRAGGAWAEQMPLGFDTLSRAGGAWDASSRVASCRVAVSAVWFTSVVASSRGAHAPCAGHAGLATSFSGWLSSQEEELEELRLPSTAAASAEQARPTRIRGQWTAEHTRHDAWAREGASADRCAAIASPLQSIRPQKASALARSRASPLTRYARAYRVIDAYR
jgi:hypothetical protein